MSLGPSRIIFLILQLLFDTSIAPFNLLALTPLQLVMRLITEFAFCALLFDLLNGVKVPTVIPWTSQFYVLPKVSTDQKSNNDILTQLKQWAVDDETISISQIGTDLSFVNFWLVGLTDDQSTQLNQTSTVCTL